MRFQSFVRNMLTSIGKGGRFFNWKKKENQNLQTTRTSSFRVKQLTIDKLHERFSLHNWRLFMQAIGTLQLIKFCRIGAHDTVLLIGEIGVKFNCTQPLITRISTQPTHKHWHFKEKHNNCYERRWVIEGPGVSLNISALKASAINGTVRRWN